VLFSLVVARAGLRERGAAMAFYIAVDWLGYLVAGPVVGYAIEFAGYDVSFVGIAAAIAAGIVLFYRLDRTTVAGYGANGLTEFRRGR
jgi:hypothetical protein